MGFLRAARPPRRTGAHPGPSAAPQPLPCSGHIRSPPSHPPPAPENQLSTFLPSAAHVLSSAVRPARGAALGGETSQQQPLPTKKDSVHHNPRYRPGLTPNSFISPTTHTLV